MSNNHLIYGKNLQDRVVSIEDTGLGFVNIYIQNEDGSISVKTEKNDYWILSRQKLDEHSSKLDGNGYYSWYNSFVIRDDFEYAKKVLNKTARTQIFYVNNPKEQFMLRSGYTYYKGLKHQEVSVLSFDIETTTLEHNKDAKILIISNTYRDSFGHLERKLFCYDEYRNERELLESWIKWVQEKDASIVIAHNGFGFDFSYISFIADRCGVDLALGRKKKVIKFDSWESKFRKDGSQFIDYYKCHIPGREIVDTFFLSLKWDTARNLKSYALKSIISELGLEVKDRQFYDASKIRDNYKIPEEWKKIKAYAMYDADDALALYDYMSAPFFYMTQNIPKSYQEVLTSASGSQLNAIMIRSYLQENHSLPQASGKVEFEGAISFGEPNIYRNVNKIDVSSLYPNIMIAYEIYDQHKDPKGNFKELVKTFTHQRLEYKKLAKRDKYYDDMQASFKIFINSCYGFLGANNLLFNSPKNAALVTQKGREILNRSIKWAKSKNYIIANGDTDAISYCKSDMSEITEVERKQQLDEVNSLFPKEIKFEPDGYFPVFVVLKAKNYIMYDGIKIKIKGSSLKDSKKEIAIKEFLDSIIKEIINGNTNYINIYANYVKEILNVKDINRWCSKKTVTDKIETSERANETKIKDALQGSEYKQGDKFYVFFKQDDTLCLAENYNGDYNVDRLLEKLYKASLIFDSILDTKSLFLNYSLKRNKKLLEAIAA